MNTPRGQNFTLGEQEVSAHAVESEEFFNAAALDKPRAAGKIRSSLSHQTRRRRKI